MTLCNALGVGVDLRNLHIILLELHFSCRWHSMHQHTFLPGSLLARCTLAFLFTFPVRLRQGISNFAYFTSHMHPGLEDSHSLETIRQQIAQKDS
jgi:hypothetical protein